MFLGRGWAAAIVLSTTMGCGTSRYVPETPHGVRSAAGTVRVVRMSWSNTSALGPSMRIVLATRFPDGARLAGVRSGLEHGTCRGTPVTAQRIDGAERWSPAPVPVSGQHDIELGVQRPTDSLGLELIDERGRSRCVRVPVPVIDHWRRSDAWFAGGGLKLDATPGDKHAIVEPVVFEAGVSRWFGPVRAGASSGVGFASCAKSVCGQDADGTKREEPGLPLGIDAQWFTPPLFRGGSRVRLGLGARTTGWVFWVPLPAGTRRIFSVEPQAMATLRVGLAPPGFRDRLGAFGMGMSGFAGGMFDSQGHRVPALGFNIFLEAGL